MSPSRRSEINPPSRCARRGIVKFYPQLPMRTAVPLLFLLSVAIWAADTNKPPQNDDVLVRSPLQTFYIEQHWVTPSKTMQVWIVSSKNATERRLLYTHGRSVEVLFSGDEDWLVINDYEGSNSGNVLLFRHQKKLDYKQVEDLTDKAWRFVAVKMGRKARAALDHHYVEGLRWTDKHTILLCLHGHLDNHNFIEDWLCFYDVRSKAFSTDLNDHNKRHTTLEPE